jgi:hypothetical protein
MPHPQLHWAAFAARNATFFCEALSAEKFTAVIFLSS